jgi:type VI secretion system protein ImpB
MTESNQEKLKRVRRPRVHITYNVETEDGREIKELPFVMGIIGDFSGNLAEELPPLEERNFVEINRDNFDDVMRRMNVGLKLEDVENTIKGDKSTFNLELKFKSIRDFEPANIVQQVKPLRELLEMRNRLRDLASKVDRSAELDSILEKVLKNTDDLQKLSAELAAAAAKPGDNKGSASDSEPGDSPKGS